MKKLSNWEFEKLEFIRARGRQISPVVAELKLLAVGQHLFLETREWHNKTHPTNSFSSAFAKVGKKFSVRTLLDKSGWAITRVK